MQPTTDVLQLSSSRTLKLSKEIQIKAEKKDSLNQTDLKSGIERLFLFGKVQFSIRPSSTQVAVVGGGRQ